MNGNVDLNKIWLKLGWHGSYQLRQTILLLVDIIPLAFTLLSTVFIAWRPPYQCQTVDDESIRTAVPALQDPNSTFSLAYKKCSIDVYTNQTNSTYLATTECLAGHAFTVPNDRTLVTEWDLVCKGAELGELQQTIVILGQVCGAAIFTSLADRYGRKPVHVLAHIGLLIFGFASAFSPNYTTFAVIRFCLGAFQQGSGLTIAIMILELFPLEYRYIAEIMGLFFWTTGVITVTPFAYFMRNLPWRYMQIALALFSWYSLIEWWLLEESLRWLIANRKFKQAERVLRKAARVNNTDYDELIKLTMEDNEVELVILSPDSKPPRDDKSPEITLLEPEETIQPNGISKSDTGHVQRYNVFTIFKHKRIFVNSLIVWYTWFVNSLVYYAISLTSSSLSGNRYMNYFLTGIVEYPAAITELLLVDRIGRRKTCMLFHLIAGIALIAATIGTTVVGNIAVVSLVCSLIAKFGITGSFSTIFLYTPELYPTNLRNVGIGMASSVARIGGMLAPFSGTLAEIVVWGPGTISAILCLLTVYLVSFLPETKGHELPTTVEELKLWYKTHGAAGRKAQREAKKKEALSSCPQ